jgi:hypothetical protein
MLFTGSAGVSPAASAKREEEPERLLRKDQSRLAALMAGGTPAVPVKSLGKSSTIKHHRETD